MKESEPRGQGLDAYEGHVGQLAVFVQRMVEESGEPEGFDASAWLATWLAHPCYALGGRMPKELMTSVHGRELVARLLGRMRSGAYS